MICARTETSRAETGSSATITAGRTAKARAMLARCRHVVRIPTRFCINLAVAGAIVMYDRLLCHGRFPPRPVHAGGPAAPLLAHRHGPMRPFRRQGGEGTG